MLISLYFYVQSTETVNVTQHRSKVPILQLMRTEPQYPSRTAEFNLSVCTLRDEHCLLRIPATQVVSTRDNYSCARNLITLFATYIGTRGFRTTSQISTAAKHGSIEVIKANYMTKKGVGKEIYLTYRSSFVGKYSAMYFISTITSKKAVGRNITEISASLSHSL